MEIKVTPWRMAYIKGTEATDNKACVLYTLPQQAPCTDNLVLFRGARCYVLMNLYPYNTGHLMVVPYAHTADLVNLEEACAAELFALTRRAVAHLQHAIAPHGFNLGMNLGRVAGAGIDEHLHMHIVPRWNGDTNFMPLLGETKLLPETLHATFERLRPLFQHDEEAAQPDS